MKINLRYFAVLFFLCSTGAHAGQDDSGLLQVKIAEIAVNERHLSWYPEHILKTAVVNGRMFYIFASNHADVSRNGIPDDIIIGILRDPLMGCVPGNIVLNPLFLERVYDTASKYRDAQLVKSIMESEAKASVLMDARVPDPGASMKVLMPDIIGVYRLKDGEIIFESNRAYEVLTENGFIRLTPFIVKKMFEANEYDYLGFSGEISSLDVEL